MQGKFFASDAMGHLSPLVSNQWDNYEINGTFVPGGVKSMGHGLWGYVAGAERDAVKRWSTSGEGAKSC